MNPVTATPDQPLLAIAQLSKTFRRGGADGTVHAVDDVTFSVDAGETVGLVGASGAGKSTVAGIIAGLLQADTGTVTFAGTELGGLKPSQRRRVQSQIHLVFQDPYSSLAPDMMVHELVAEPLRIHQRLSRQQRRAQALAALEEVQLTPAARYADRLPRALSGGERQRVALARAIILHPQLIIADEPTSMLDASLRADLAALLADLRRRHGMAGLHITHDIALAHRMCDRLLVMHDGRIVEQGATADVIARPIHPRTVALVDAVRSLQAPLSPPH